MTFLMLLRGGDFFGLIEGGFAILVLAGLLAVAAWGVTRILPSRRGGRAVSAEEILRERFARGEISAEEYVKSYEVLHETPAGEELRRLRAVRNGAAEAREGYGLVAVGGAFEGDGLLASSTPRREPTQGRLKGSGGPRCMV